MIKLLILIPILTSGCVTISNSIDGKSPKFFCINDQSNFKVKYPSGESIQVNYSSNDQIRRGYIYYEDDVKNKFEIGKKYTIPKFTEEIENNFHVFFQNKILKQM